MGRFLTADHVTEFARECPKSASSWTEISQSSNGDHPVLFLGMGLICGTINIPNEAFALVGHIFSAMRENDNPLANLQGITEPENAADLAVMEAVIRPSDISGTSFRDRQIPLTQKYAFLINKYGTNYEANSFHDLLNELQKKKSSNDDFLMQGLYQVFWFLTSYGFVHIDPHKIQDQKYLNYQFHHFNYGAEEYLLEIGRHIYNTSFR